MLLSFIDRTDETAGLSLSLTPRRVVCVWHVVNTDLPSGCLDVWRSVARGRLSVSVSLSFCPSLHLFVRSLLPPSLCLSLNIVFHLVFISFVSFTDDSLVTINRSISQTVWTRTTIFHHTDSLCVCEVWGFVPVLVEVQDIVLWVRVPVCVGLRFTSVLILPALCGFLYSCCLNETRPIMLCRRRFGIFKVKGSVL